MPNQLCVMVRLQTQQSCVKRPGCALLYLKQQLQLAITPSKHCNTKIYGQRDSKKHLLYLIAPEWLESWLVQVLLLLLQPSTAGCKSQNSLHSRQPLMLIPAETALSFFGQRMEL